jgi:hypothetical protein
MKYLIVEHSRGKYFGFNLCESNKGSTMFSIVQDKDEFMVMGWKVAKVIPTWVLGFVYWNNLMTSYNATLRQDFEMVNTANDVFNANNVNVGNNDEQNTQGQERVNCLKIDKRCKWVRYLTQQKEITMTDTYNNERLTRIKEENINIIKGKIHLDVEASITNMIMNPNEEWLARKKTHHLT